MPQKSLRRQANFLFGLFFLLVVLSSGVILWGVNEQEHDAAVINLAGRQRMLTQQMTWLALNQPGSSELGLAVDRFDHTQHVLRNGGEVVDAMANVIDLPPAPDSELITQLDEIDRFWSAFRALLEPLLRADQPLPLDAGAAEKLQAGSIELLEHLDTAVSMFEARSEAKVNRLLWMQGIFLGAALLLLLWGYQVTRSRLVVPLAALNSAASRIGRGDFSTPVASLRGDELGELARALESMRAELGAAQGLLEDRVKARTSELVTAFEFSQEIVAQAELPLLLQSVVDRARQLVRAEIAFLCLNDQEGAYLELAAQSGGVAVAPGYKQPIGDGLALTVFSRNGLLIVESECAGCRYLSAQEQGSECMVTSVHVGEQTLGALCLSRDPGEAFDPDEQRALSLLANSAAIAIENARMAEMRDQEARIKTRLEERERLAAELHDNLAQTISYLRLQTERVQNEVQEKDSSSAQDTLQRMRGILENAYLDVRRALSGLAPAPSKQEDLTQRLEQCAEEFQEQSGLPVKLEVNDVGALDLPPAVRTQVVHIVRGALANVQRHANAQHVEILGRLRAGGVWFTVEDDGVGFDPGGLRGGDHLGLQIMRARAERSGGELIVDSTPRQGTRVIARFPLL